MSVTGACVKILYKILGGKELPPNLKRRCTPEKASTFEASLGLIHLSKSTGGLPSLQFQKTSCWMFAGAA